MEPTVITAIIGAIATITAAIIGTIAARSKDKAYSELQKEWGEYKKAASKHNSYLNIEYGIRIISPVDEPVHGDTIEVRGTYNIMPPPETLRLFTVAPERTSYGERFWPQEIVKEFFPETKTWRAKADISGFPESGGKLVAAIVSQPAIVLWNFYYKVGPKIGWWDIEGWPNDSIECHRVNITRIR